MRRHRDSVRFMVALLGVRRRCGDTKAATGACPASSQVGTVGAGSGQVTATSDPLPQILQGIPIAYRDVRVEVNRKDFTLNPANCAQRKVTSTITSATGQTASPSSSFQASGCTKLDFAPQLSLEVSGGTKPQSYPALSALPVNSHDLCAGPNKATVELDGQNGKSADQRPAVANSCSVKAKKKSEAKRSVQANRHHG